MDADFSIELGPEDPVLDLPWKDPAGNLTYFDLKRHPELIASINEAEKCPPLRDLLCAINLADSPFETAKCDVWTTSELAPEEETWEASQKFASYVDVVFSHPATRLSLSHHEQFARKLVASLQRAPEVRGTIEIYVRRCFFEQAHGVTDGFYYTFYVNGYGNTPHDARQAWESGLTLLSKHLCIEIPLDKGIERGPHPLKS